MNRTFAVWALSLVGGSAIAFFLLTYGARALLLLALALIAAARAHPRGVAIGGQLVGLGGTIALLEFPYIAACAGVGDWAGLCRTSTAYETWLLLAGLLIAFGVLLGLRRPGAGTPSSSTPRV